VTKVKHLVEQPFWDSLKFVKIVRKGLYVQRNGSHKHSQVQGTREEVIEKFKVYFKERLEDPLYKVLVLQLRGNKLGCFCKPKACHGDVIKEWLDGQ
jgi:hypothetical protein